MLFNSYIFIFLFLPVTLSIFFWIGRHNHAEAAVGWLVIASLFFYGWWNPAYLILIIFSIFFNYAAGLVLAGQKTQTRRGKILLAFGVTVNLGLLGYFKYANFFVNTINDALGANFHLHSIVLPLAISFFTFQQIAFLVDAYRGEAREYNFLHYCLFVTFFPQLIAGPIVHHQEMLPQFMRKATYQVDPSNVAVGTTIFFIGLFKKVILADNFALHATPVFEAAEAGATLTFFSAWKGVFAYTLQLYFDFSGYSDMAIGLARMFGIRLPINFNSPYQATSIIDFWRRWHITLSRFLRDYLYIPLGGNKNGKSRRYANLLITMVLGGLWHGAGWTFVAWGTLHGAFLIVNHIWRQLWRSPINRWWSRTIARSITLLAVMFAWVFFRAETFAGAEHLLRAMVNLPTTLQEALGPFSGALMALGLRFEGGFFGINQYVDLAWLVFWLGVLWAWPNTQQWLARFSPALDAHVKPTEQPLGHLWQRVQWRPNAVWAVAVSITAVSAILGLTQATEFLYFQF